MHWDREGTGWAGSFTSPCFEGVVAAACLQDIFFCGFAFFIFLKVSIGIKPHLQFELWNIVTTGQGHRSPDLLTVRKASVASCPILFSPHLAWQLPSSFFICCSNREQCFVSVWKQEDLNTVFHTCMATSSSWDFYVKYVLSCFRWGSMKTSHRHLSHPQSLCCPSIKWSLLRQPKYLHYFFPQTQLLPFGLVCPQEPTASPGSAAFCLPYRQHSHLSFNSGQFKLAIVQNRLLLAPLKAA